MDSAITDSEPELTALIRRHGKWCLMLATIGTAVGIGAWFGLPKQYETSALMRLDGSAQARLSTSQWVASLYSRDSTFESFAVADLDAGELRRSFRSRTTGEDLFLRLSLRSTAPDVSRLILEKIAKSLEARDFVREGGARVVASLPAETAARPISPRLSLLTLGGGALGGFIGLLASLLRKEKSTS